MYVIFLEFCCWWWGQGNVNSISLEHSLVLVLFTIFQALDSYVDVILLGSI